MRAVAIAFVVLRHWDVSQLIPGGFGVTLFFFISGFLITRLLLAEERAFSGVNLPRFYLRRLIRLGPALLVMLAVTSLAALTQGYIPPSREVFAALLYYMNYHNIFALLYDIPRTMRWTDLWSLAIEEHFYLVFPFVFFVLLTGRRSTFIGLIALLVVPLLLRAYYVGFLPRGEIIAYWSTETRVDSLVWGAALAFLADDGRAKWLRNARNRPSMAFSGLTLLFVSLIWQGRWTEGVLSFSVQGVALLMLFNCLLFGQIGGRMPRRILESDPVAWIGRRSYAIYLWHWPLYAAVGIMITNYYPAKLAITGLATLGVAHMSYVFVERPFAQLRLHLRTSAMGSGSVPMTPDGLYRDRVVL
jgi:peptidoglycan/LPS O-acetylase OafA/YrhL